MERRSDLEDRLTDETSIVETPSGVLTIKLIIMKAIYVIELSEDGLDINAYSNIKALYNGLTETNYKTETVDYLGEIVKFSYANLVKMLRKSGQDGKYYEKVYVGNKSGYATITITQLPIKTK